jgi:hypothetical protein
MTASSVSCHPMPLAHWQYSGRETSMRLTRLANHLANHAGAEPSRCMLRVRRAARALSTLGGLTTTW